MLITDDYLALNRQLHEGGRYGVSGSRWADAVKALREKYECETVLDYGCGRGLLGVALGSPSWLSEYDPAIDGKNAPPKRADLLVCTDVLEHIEPDCLDDVLGHIRQRAGKIAFLNIATRPAQKVLADGRNAHLIVEPAPWWEERLKPYFQIIEFDVRDGAVNLLVSPRREIGDINAKSAVSDAVRGEQMRINLPRVAGRLEVEPRHDRTAILACYGPSLTETWKDIDGGDVCTVSGAHDFLIERGIVPKFHMECDPREQKARYTATPHRDVIYYMASCCHPKAIDQLLDHDVRLWHVGTDEGALKALNDMEPNALSVTGGGSIGLRAMCVLFTMGYRTFIIHGMDCSFADDGEQHAAAHFGKRMSESPVQCGDRWFRSSLTMVSYARFFFKQISMMCEHAKRNGEPAFADGEYVRFGLAGDGLLQEMARQQHREAEA